MRVRALGDPEKVVGYYNHRRIKGGEIFNIENEKAFSENWMENVGSSVESAEIESQKKTDKKRGKRVVQADEQVNDGTDLPGSQVDEDVL